MWIENCKKIIAALPDDVKLGLYECPYPYKRLVTPEILDFCLSTEKFYYMKDTCCNAEMIAARVAQLKGSHFKLLTPYAKSCVRQMELASDQVEKLLL